jgi:hypothetical protein
LERLTGDTRRDDVYAAEWPEQIIDRKYKRNKQEGLIPVGETAGPNRLFGARHKRR